MNSVFVQLLHVRARGVIKLLSVSGFFAGIFLVFGFFWFQSIISSYQINPLVKADGIVVLTGGQHRISTGLSLLEKHRGTRLLISGVHAATSRDTLLRMSGRRVEPHPCCIDIGHVAKNTVGNAREIADWVKLNGFESLIVVTSDYHMPRALKEIGHLVPRISLLPYIAQNDDVTSSEQHIKNLRLSLIEYSKYLAVIGRMFIVQTKPLTSLAKAG